MKKIKLTAVLALVIFALSPLQMEAQTKIKELKENNHKTQEALKEQQEQKRKDMQEKREMLNDKQEEMSKDMDEKRAEIKEKHDEMKNEHLEMSDQMKQKADAIKAKMKDATPEERKALTENLKEEQMAAYKNNQQRIEKRQDFVQQSQLRLDAARAKTKTLLEQQQITAEEAQTRLERIDNLEQRLKAHQAKIEEVRAKVVVKKAQLDQQEETIEAIED